MVSAFTKSNLLMTKSCKGPGACQGSKVSSLNTHVQNQSHFIRISNLELFLLFNSSSQKRKFK